MSLAMQSRWADTGGESDSNAWRRAILPLGERDASLAIRNDDYYLYVAFLTTDPELQERIRNQGIYIWFDPNGGEARRFGIRYPVAWGTLPASMDELPHPESTLPGSPATGWGRPGDDLEIYTDGYKEYERMGKKDAGGIEVQVTKLSDTLLCQLRVPLREHSRGPYAVSAAPGDLIGVGIETRANRATGESVDSILPFKVWRTVQLSSSPHPSR
ncbi:MAG TPA: hypothetical protein VF514_10930 [Bacteroidota bacterium]